VVDQIEAPYMPIDDSAVENALRPVSVGWKYCLHQGSDRGGRRAAVLISLVQSGRVLGNAPHAYLQDVLNRVDTHPASRVEDLSLDRRVLPGR
jgi:hypothetical protein